MRVDLDHESTVERESGGDVIEAFDLDLHLLRFSQGVMVAAEGSETVEGIEVVVSTIDVQRCDLRLPAQGILGVLPVRIVCRALREHGKGSDIWLNDATAQADISPQPPSVVPAVCADIEDDLDV